MTKHSDNTQVVDAENTGNLSIKKSRFTLSKSAFRRWKLVLLILIAFSPVIFTGVGIYKNAVNIPTWDDWERGPMLQKYHDGTLDLKYMDGPHIDHRMLFPRLIQLGLNGITGGDLRAEIFVSYAIFVLGGVAMFFLIRRTLGKDSAWVWPVAFLINTILFSPLQYQNFLWAVQLAIMIPIACLPIAILVMVSKIAWWKKLLAATAIAIVGTHSFAHGILLWPVVFCLGLLLKDFGGSWKQRTAFLTIFVAAAVTVISAYFLWNFQNVSTHSYGVKLGETPPSGGALTRITENTERFKRYFMYVLGSPFARIFNTDPYQAAKNVTRGSIYLFVIGVGFMFWRRKDKQDWDRLLPWVAMGVFSICAAVLMASGRCMLNVDRALLPRYISLTMFLGIAIIAMAAFMFQRWRSKAENPLVSTKRLQIPLILAALFVGIQFTQWVYGFHKMEAWRFARLQERTSLLYVNHFSPDKVGRIDTSLAFPLEQANFLNSKGYLKPALFDKPDFGTFSFVNTKLTKGRGAINRAAVGDDRKLYVDGFAILPDENRMADGVLWVWRPKGDIKAEWKVLGVSEMHGMHVPRTPFIDSQFSGNMNYGDKEKYARWKGMLNLNTDASGSSFPTEKIELMCFAMDTDRMELHPFDVILEFDCSSIPMDNRLVIADNNEG